MKRLFTAVALACALLLIPNLNAQIIKGDMNADSKVDISDLNECINVILAKSPVKYVPGNYVVNSVVAGTWTLSQSDKYIFNTNGTTTYPGAATYKYVPQKSLLFMFDGSGQLTEVFNVTSVDKYILSIKPFGTDTTINLFKDSQDMSGKDAQGREYVDLLLPSGTLWAACNVGASSPEGFGLYFEWGVTRGYAANESHRFDWFNYPLCTYDADWIFILHKYVTNAWFGTVDHKTTLEPIDDAATANWGSEWRMPTAAELEELCNPLYTTYSEASVNGVSGFKITSKRNGKSLFFPFAGRREYDSINYVGTSGYYWSSNISNSNMGATAMQNDVYYSTIDRYIGQSVRPVRRAKK